MQRIDRLSKYSMYMLDKRDYYFEAQPNGFDDDFSKFLNILNYSSVCSVTLRVCEILDSKYFFLISGLHTFPLDSTFWLDSTLKLHYASYSMKLCMT